MGKSLAKLLRERKTIAKNIATFKERALSNAVLEENMGVPDFDAKKCIADFISAQNNLRNIKENVSKESIKNTVKIPQTAPVAEAGEEVSLYRAILIRDDLKAQKQFFEQLIAIPSGPERYGYGENSILTNRVRQFDKDVVLDLIDRIQESIDTIDSLIQYMDNTVVVGD